MTIPKTTIELEKLRSDVAARLERRKTLASKLNWLPLFAYFVPVAFGGLHGMGMKFGMTDTGAGVVSVALVVASCLLAVWGWIVRNQTMKLADSLGDISPEDTSLILSALKKDSALSPALRKRLEEGKARGWVVGELAEVKEALLLK